MILKRPHTKHIIPFSPDLARRLYALEPGADVLVRPPLAEVLQRGVGGVEHAQLDQEDADHGAGSALAALAVHGHRVQGVLGQPVDYLKTEKVRWNLN